MADGLVPDLDTTPPETSMPARRWLAYLATGALIALLWVALPRVPPQDVLGFTYGLMFLITVVWLFYFGGASAHEITAVIQSFKVKMQLGKLSLGSGDDDDKPAGGE